MGKFYDMIDSEELKSLLKQYLLENDSQLTEEALQIALQHAAGEVSEGEITINKAKERKMLDKLRRATHGENLGAAGEILY